MRRIALVLPVLLVAGCGSDPMSSEDVLGQAGALEKPLPGLYRTQAELVSFDVPGVPPADADRMRSQMEGLSSQPQQQCLTKEEADRGFEDLLKAIGEGTNGLVCGFESFETNPPALDAVLACEGNGMEAEIGFDGTAGAEGLDLAMTMEASTPVIPGQNMTMGFAVTSERLGDCPST